MSQVRYQSSVAVVDERDLRRAGLIRLLEPWASAEKLKIASFAPARAHERLAGKSAYGMLIFSIGGEVLSEQENHQKLEVLRSLAPNASLVVFSDREDAHDIALALRIGVQGFIFSGIRSSLAFQALSFILNGGAYFPPAPFREIQAVPNAPSVASIEAPVSARLDSPGEDLADGARGVIARPDNLECDLVNLTSRQREVLNRIRRGESNKMIGRQLGMTEGTVKVHVRQMMRKLGVSNRTQLAIRGLHIHQGSQYENQNL